MPVYETTATLLINEIENRQFSDNTQILQGLGLPGGMQNLQNQMMILKSRDLVDKTLENLPFEVEFFFKTLRNTLPIYPEVPLLLVYNESIPLPRDVEFSISFLGRDSLLIKSESNYYSLESIVAFGDSINLGNSSLSFEPRDLKWIDEHRERKLHFIINSKRRLINYYSNRLKVDLISSDGSLLKLSMSGTNPLKDAVFLNEHIVNFQNISFDRKNLEAERRIQFIDNQLDWITDTLSTTETKLQQFRSAHRIMDLSVQGQSIIGQVTLLENERARLNLEANYYDYLADYLNKAEIDEVPIVPITMGISDATLSRLVEELAALQGQLTTTGAGEMNPLQRNLEQRILSAKAALRETLNGLRRANSLARSENQEQINKANSQAAALPATERQLLGIERKFRLNDELYTFLLETRSELQMQKASNTSDSEIIDRADERFSMLISPDPFKIYSAGIFVGLVIPALIIYLLFALNQKLKYEDIRYLTRIPIVGHIPFSMESTSNIVLESPNSIAAEAFRILRSKMQFLTKDAECPIILVTSAMPDDGKTFVAINLASAYSLLGKKTVLVGFDLRKSKIHEHLKISNEVGISTWLIGRAELNEIVHETSFDSLYVVNAGPVPPNPSELIALERTKSLLNLLKERFDYIVIDSAPIGVVSDTYHLAAHADANLIIVRPGMTIKEMLSKTLNEIKGADFKGTSIVVNAIKSGDKSYGYTKMYNYSDDKRKKNRRFKILSV